MTSLTHNDYLTQQGHGQNWSLNVNSCNKLITEDFHAECINGAKIIADTAKEPLILLYSGGLDGEYMLNVFREAKIPFKTAIISYGDWNEHDTAYAFSFCEQKGIDPIVVDIDIEDFIKSGKIYDVAKQAKCCAYQMPSIMYGLTKLEGTLIMANGEPYLKNYDGVWKWQETERVNSYMNWYTQNNIDGTPDFLRFTPEITYSFLQEPRVKELVQNKHPGKLSTRTSKHMIYSKAYRFVPRPKYTGWEEIEKSNLISEELLNNFEILKSEFNGVYELEYNDLLETLKPGKNTRN